MSDNPFAPPTTNASSPAAAQSGSQHAYRSTKVLLTAVQFGVVLYILAAAASLILNTIGTLSYPTFSDINADLTDETEQLLVFGIFGSAMVNVLGLLVAAVATCMFMNRSNKNARALGATGLEFSPGWTVGVWFIPIINLFRPYYAMKEIQLASTAPAGSQWKNIEPSGLLTAWWACWLIGGMIERGLNRAELRGADFGVGGLAFHWVAAILLIIAGILLITILKQVFELQSSAANKSLM